MKLKAPLISFAVAMLGLCASAEMSMEMSKGYALYSGVWKGWTYNELECVTDHDYGGIENPWSYERWADASVLIPVTGCGVDKIRPVIVNGSATAADGLKATVLSDWEMAKKMGVIDHWDKFTQDYEGDEYWCTVGKTEYELPPGIWIDGMVRDDRQWIVVDVSTMAGLGTTGLFSPRTFSVGIVGTNLITPQITLVPDRSSFMLLKNANKFTSKNLFGLDVAITRYGDDPDFGPETQAWTWLYPGASDSVGHRVYYTWDTDTDDDWEGGELTITASGAGRIYCSLVDDWYLGEYMDYAGDIMVEGGENVSKSDFGLEIEVAKAGKVKLSDFGEKLCVNGLWFRPASVAENECIAVEALYQEHVRLANDRVQSRYRCYVTGMGVAKFGDSIELVCLPNEGEVFDHWEFVGCDAPAGVNLNSTTLRVPSTAALRAATPASIGGLKIVQVRPVLKPRRTIMVLPSPAGYATVVGNGAYFEGDDVTVTLKPRKGCEFVGWSDNDSSGLTRTFKVPEGTETTIVYANFTGTPQFGPSGSYGFVKGTPLGDDYDFSDLIGYSVKGLPAGMKFNPATGELTGTPTSPGLYDVVFTKKGEETYTTTIVVSGYENEDIWVSTPVSGGRKLIGFQPGYWPTGTIFVPSEIGGEKVVRLGTELFSPYDDVRTIVVAEGIKYLDDRALYCHAERIILPSTLEYDSYFSVMYHGGSWTGTYWVPPFGNSNYTKKIEFAGGRTASADGKTFIQDNMLFCVRNVSGYGTTTNLIGIAGAAVENKPVVIPDGVTGIFCGVFEDVMCSEISFPSSLVALGGEWGGGYVFGWTDNLKRVEVRGEGSPYKVIGGSLVDTRTGTLVLATAGTEIPSDGSVSAISTWAFSGCPKTSVTVPTNVHTIARSAFMDAWKMQTINISADTTNIYGGAFTSLESLKGFYIDADNPAYEVVNGCVIDKRSNMLISPCCGKASVCEVPYFCEQFADDVFKDEYCIQKVVLPKNMTPYNYSDFYSDGFAAYSDIEYIEIAGCGSEEEMIQSSTYDALMDTFQYWSYKLEEFHGFSYTDNPQVAVRCRGRVSAKGYGRYKPGAKVTLTATAADKGYCVRWLNEKGEVVGDKSSYSFEMDDSDVCYTVEAVLGTGAVLRDEIPELFDLEKVVIPNGHCVDGARGDNPEHTWVFGYATAIKISGLPAGIGYEARTVPGGIWVKLTGTATKVDVSKVTFVATYEDKTTKTSEKYFVVTEDQGKYIRIFDGTTTTEKFYAAGAKVSLSPKGPKGTYFAGWYTSPNFEETSRFTALWDFEDADYRAAKFFIRRPGQIDPDALYARFITKNEDSVCTISFECGTEWTVGGPNPDPDVTVESATTATVTAKGLPAGITFKNGELLYDATKIRPGTTVVTFMAKNLSGGTDTKKLTIIVPNKQSGCLPNLPYDTPIQAYAGVPKAGFLDLTVPVGYEVVTISGLPAGMKATKNKTTGQWVVGGVPTKSGDFTVTITAKNGKLIETATVTVTVTPLPEWAQGNFELCMYQSYYKHEPYYWWDALRGTMTITSNGSLALKVSEASSSNLEVDSVKGQYTEYDPDAEIYRIGKEGLDVNDAIIEVFETNICGVVFGAVRGWHTPDSECIDLAEIEGWPIFGCQNVWKKYAGTFWAPEFVKGAYCEFNLTGCKTGYGEWKEDNADKVDLVEGCKIRLAFGKAGAITTTFYEKDATKPSGNYAAQLMPYNYDQGNNKLYAFTTVMFQPKGRHGVGAILMLEIDVSDPLHVKGSDVEVIDCLLEY